MAVQYKYEKRLTNADEGMAVMEKVFPLLNEHWEKQGKSFYNNNLVFNYEAFINLWITGALVLVTARENDNVVGVFVGISHSPVMISNKKVLQVENCYGKTDEIEIGLYNYIKSISDILGYDELWLATDANKSSSAVSAGFNRVNSSEIIRFKAG